MAALARTIQTLCAATLVGCLSQALAQSTPSYGPAVTIATAKRIAAGALAEAQKHKWNVAIAVVDNHGVLVYYEMMDDTQTASAQVAVDKARAAAMYRRSTREFQEGVSKGFTAILGLTGATPIAGGLPIVLNGKVAGGLGVSGVTPDQDEQVAAAGRAALK